MKMYVYRGETPNFGDDLNDWMWPQLLPSFFDQNLESIFLGIGSTIFNSLPPSATKVVFGAGFGGYTAIPVIDSTWKIFFVRGKITARALNISEDLALGDAGILIRSCEFAKPIGPTFKVSFIPHWESALWGAWPKVCQLSGIHYINPAGSVPDVLNEIRSSQLVITEAMHGAIISDALRVPWIPIKPLRAEHRMKWQDWASALNLDLKPFELRSSTALESVVSRMPNQRWIARVRGRSRISRILLNLYQSHWTERAAQALRTIAAQPATLSADTAISSAHERMLEKLEDLKRAYPTPASH